MSPFVFLIAALAVYRIADILAEEEGPLAIFSKARRKVPAHSNAGRGVRCSYCVGIYVSALVTAWLWWCGLVPTALAVPYGFGVAGAAALCKRVAG